VGGNVEKISWGNSPVSRGFLGKRGDKGGGGGESAKRGGVVFLAGKNEKQW